ncbi:hypothetical protein KJZ63_03365 [Patescibacteria group bacterium]|nr:hypothetical protein [Patescibacteria group bacterium]
MKSLITFMVGIFSGLLIAVVSFFAYQAIQENLNLISPLVLFDKNQPKELPLLKYRISALDQFDLVESDLRITKKVSENENFDSYLFSFMTQGGSMSGKLNWPKNSDHSRAIVMIRGYVPPEIYQSGVGTQAAAEVFAKEGFVTLSPDFLGFGESSPDYEDSWEGRFVKPVQVMELIKSLEKTDLALAICQYEAVSSNRACNKQNNLLKIGLWAHSNGGQIALTMIEGFEVSYPTTLWAPVTAPFPYSVLFFTDEVDDEGKASRSWVSIFEKDYDVFDFSLAKHLDRLRGPLQIHHGTADEAALFSWSLEFAQKLDLENERRSRQIAANKVATEGARVQVFEPIEYELLKYDGADHNMRPSWSAVVARDLLFFKKHLGEN